MRTMCRRQNYGPGSAIPWIDRAPINPLDPIALAAAGARSEGQGRRPGLQKCDCAADATRPRTARRRRSLALDRSEHAGALYALRVQRSGVTGRWTIPVGVACAFIAAQPPVALAGPPSQHPGVVGTIAPVVSSAPWRMHIADAAQRFEIPETWMRAVIDVADVRDPSILSARGAMGLMQLTPETWRIQRDRHGLGDDPYQPRDNIMAGAAYLRELSERYGSLRAAMTAYHAGPERFEEHLATDFALPDDTVAFVAKVVAVIGETDDGVPAFASATDVGWTEAPLFVARAKSQSDDTIPLAEQSSETPTRGASTMLTPASGELFARRGQPGAAQR